MILIASVALGKVPGKMSGGIGNPLNASSKRVRSAFNAWCLKALKGCEGIDDHQSIFYNATKHSCAVCAEVSSAPKILIESPTHTIIKSNRQKIDLVSHHVSSVGLVWSVVFYGISFSYGLFHDK